VAGQPEQRSEIRFQTSHLIITRPEQVSIPIPLDEWDELVDSVRSCRVTIYPWAIAYSVAFGVGVTAGLSIAPIAFSRLPWWVLTIYTVFCALGLGMGIICVVAERVLARRQQSQIDRLIFQMERTKAAFTQPPS
jgi:hypothetical protein